MSSESLGDFLWEARTEESALFRTHYVAAITALKVLVTRPTLFAMNKPTFEYGKVGLFRLLFDCFRWNSNISLWSNCHNEHFCETLIQAKQQTTKESWKTLLKLLELEEDVIRRIQTEVELKRIVKWLLSLWWWTVEIFLWVKVSLRFRWGEGFHWQVSRFSVIEVGRMGMNDEWCSLPLLQGKMHQRVNRQMTSWNDDWLVTWRSVKEQQGGWPERAKEYYGSLQRLRIEKEGMNSPLWTIITAPTHHKHILPLSKIWWFINKINQPYSQHI